MIDDSSLDAEAISQSDSIENDVNWGLFLNYWLETLLKTVSHFDCSSIVLGSEGEER